MQRPLNPNPVLKKKATPTKRRVAAHLHFQLVMAVVLILVGCGLLVAGFTVPPLGEIHPSLLVAFGEILTFVGAICGIDYHYKATIYNKHP